MKKDEFISLVQECILPLFTGSSIVGDEESSSRDNFVAQGEGGTILCKPNKDCDFRIIIEREQPFKRYEIKLVKSILEELDNVDKYNILESAYNKTLQQYAIEKAICKSVSDKNYKVILSLIYELSIWRNRTYEGTRPNFAFVISPKNISSDGTQVHFSKIISKGFSALLSKAQNSIMFLNSKGYLIKHISLANKNDYRTYAPIEYINFAKACTKGRIGITLIETGDLLLFNEGELVFAKRGGSWSSYSHDEVIKKISGNAIPELQEAIYLSALDVSFEQTGGCICHVKKEYSTDVISHIDLYDLINQNDYEKKLQMLETQKLTSESKEQDEEQNDEHDEQDKYPTYEEFLQQERGFKVATIKKIINGRKFQELDRTLRASLIGIDGATIIDYEGNIICVGAIIEINAGSSSGGRMAATRTLAKYGTSMKISTDCTIISMSWDHKKQRAKTLFIM